LHLDSGIETVFDDALYRASANDMMKYLGRTGDGALSVLLIGHNPGISDLVGMLTTEPERVGPISAVGLDGRYTAPLPDAESKHASSLPTAGLADLRFMIPSWSDIQPGTAVLDHIVMPRNLV
jgi:phosphohistidine phosphatase